MSPVVVVVLLGSALLHASWNALLKSGSDRLASIATMGAVSAIIAFPFALSLPLPDRAALPFLLASAALQIAYCVTLVRAYAGGDLAQVYPIARGSSPLLVTVGAAVVVDERLDALALVGVALVSLGIASTVLAKSARPPPTSALLAAFVTGALIASYTVVDGMGSRASGAPLSYIAWLFVLQGAPMPLVYRVLRGRFPPIVTSRSDAWKGVEAALASSAAYGSVVWALSQSPMGATSALRETSVLFAALLGRVALREELTRARSIGCIAIAIGAVCLGWSR